MSFRRKPDFDRRFDQRRGLFIDGEAISVA